MDNRKSILFFDSLAEQERYGLLASLDMSAEERLHAMYELNERLYGTPTNLTGNTTIELFVAQPDESINEFFRRINGDDS